MSLGWKGRSSSTVPFGLRDGKLWFVTDVEPGIGCGCYCPDPACNRPLVARNKPSVDRKRAYHFMHANQSGVCGGRESALHRMAKELILRADTLALPRWSSGEVVIPPAELKVCGQPAKEVTLLDGRTRPDVRVSGACGGIALDDLYVEVRVSHAVDLEKAALVQANRLSMMEINLSDVTDEQLQDADTFSHIVLREPSNRVWINLGAPSYLAAFFGREVVEVPSVDTFVHTVPFRNGQGHWLHTKQKVVSHGPGLDPWESAIELEQFTGIGEGTTDRLGQRLPYPPGLYWRYPGSNTFKTLLAPIRTADGREEQQQGHLFVS